MELNHPGISTTVVDGRTRMKKPAPCNVTENEMQELLALAKACFPQEKYHLLKAIFDTFSYIQHTWDAKNRSI